MSSCSPLRQSYQPFPASGRLAGNLDTHLPQLRDEHGDCNSTVYCYVISTVVSAGGDFVQTGSGPNWQGGLTTLCTCKHQLRCFRRVTDWPGTWIAGFTGISFGRNYLVYLMQVGHAFESHADLWLALDPTARRAKETSRQGNTRGDLYTPSRPLSGLERFDPELYLPPCTGHVHGRDSAWRKDIECYRYGRPAALLVGYPAQSYLWSAPCIASEQAIGRGQRKLALSQLLRHDLQESADCR